jgi:hypothetical protein
VTISAANVVNLNLNDQIKCRNLGSALTRFHQWGGGI